MQRDEFVEVEELIAHLFIEQECNSTQRFINIFTIDNIFNDVLWNTIYMTAALEQLKQQTNQKREMMLPDYHH